MVNILKTDTIERTRRFHSPTTGFGEGKYKRDRSRAIIRKIRRKLPEM